MYSPSTFPSGPKIFPFFRCNSPTFLAYNRIRLQALTFVSRHFFNRCFGGSLLGSDLLPGRVGRRSCRRRGRRAWALDDRRVPVWFRRAGGAARTPVTETLAHLRWLQRRIRSRRAPLPLLRARREDGRRTQGHGRGRPYRAALRDAGTLSAETCEQIYRSIEARQASLLPNRRRRKDVEEDPIPQLEAWFASDAAALSIDDRKRALALSRSLPPARLRELSAVALVGIARLQASVGMLSRACQVYKVLFELYPDDPCTHAAALEAIQTAQARRLADGGRVRAHPVEHSRLSRRGARTGAGHPGCSTRFRRADAGRGTWADGHRSARGGRDGAAGDGSAGAGDRPCTAERRAGGAAQLCRVDRRVHGGEEHPLGRVGRRHCSSSAVRSPWSSACGNAGADSVTSRSSSSRPSPAPCSAPAFTRCTTGSWNRRAGACC